MQKFLSFKMYKKCDIMHEKFNALEDMISHIIMTY